MQKTTERNTAKANDLNCMPPPERSLPCVNGMVQSSAALSNPTRRTTARGGARKGIRVLLPAH